MFDEVKLIKTSRFSAGHIIGHANNAPNEQATSALCTEAVRHQGGPRMLFGIHPVKNMNSADLQIILLEIMEVMKKSGVRPISFLCDNCPLNQGVYRLLGGPGRVVLDGIEVFLLYDFVHIMKNLRNNWITDKLQELSFVEDGVEYLACWKDIQALYEADNRSSLRLTKLTHTSVFPKPLQRQSVPLVCQVFHAALKALKNTVNPQQGTIRFITMVTNWFKMMNVKDKFGAINLRDPFRAPWTLNCENFDKLLAICDVIGSCRWEGGKNRQRKLTKFTADAFIVTTKFSVAAATYLLTNHQFEFVLSAVFSQDPLEKFFGQARQRTVVTSTLM